MGPSLRCGPHRERNHESPTRLDLAVVGVLPKADTAKSALLCSKLRKQTPKVQLFTIYEKVQEVGEDAFGLMKHTRTVAQRRLVASAFINDSKSKQVNHDYSRRSSREWMGTPLRTTYPFQCTIVFRKRKECENQHPYVAMLDEPAQLSLYGAAPAAHKASTSSIRMSVNPSRNPTQRMSVPAVKPE